LLGSSRQASAGRLPRADLVATEVVVLARDIAAAQRGLRAPPALAGNLSEWASAIALLLREGELEAAEFGTRRLVAASPTANYGKNLAMVFDRLPPLGSRHIPFRDDLTEEVQVVRRPGADTVILAFCDFAHHLGLPISMMHRWLGQLPASIIYLRDFRCLCHLPGVQALGADREPTLEELRRIVGLLGAKRVLCYGTSSGVFPALHYGLELRADAVLALAGPTNLSVAFSASREGSPMSRIQKLMPEAAIDLRQPYADAAHPPRALIVYAENEWDDRLQAENLAGLPSITLHAVEGSAVHNVTMTLIRLGRFPAVVDWLIAGTAPR
jgi:hypothetical protein